MGSSVKLARAITTALWLATTTFGALTLGTLAVVPAVMEQKAPPSAVPWLFTALAVAASSVASTVARLIPSIATAYSWRRLTLAGIPTWALAWWTGTEVGRVLDSVGRSGVFAISVGILDAVLWSGAICVAAVLLLADGDAATGRPAMPTEGAP